MLADLLGQKVRVVQLRGCLVLWEHMNTVMVLLVALPALGSVSLLKAYRRIPERELKRRAREGDELATGLYPAVAYGQSLTTLLWFVVGIANAVFFVVLVRNTPAWFAVSASALLIWTAFVWLPGREVTRLTAKVAVWLAPVFAWILNFAHPVIDGVIGLFGRFLPAGMHTGLYDRIDLLELLHYQHSQPDSRIHESELSIALHALSFSHRQIREVMTPRHDVKLVSAEEAVGPVLMSELHDSGFSRLPVYRGRKGNIVGLVEVKALANARAGGQVQDVMQSDLHFVHEEQSLTDALQAVLKTRRQFFVVVNSHEEFVGVLTMGTVLEQVIGDPTVDEFAQYDDMHAVAARSLVLQPEPIPEEVDVPQESAEEPAQGID